MKKLVVFAILFASGAVHAQAGQLACNLISAKGGNPLRSNCYAISNVTSFLDEESGERQVDFITVKNKAGKEIVFCNNNQKRALSDCEAGIPVYLAD